MFETIDQPHAIVDLSLSAIVTSTSCCVAGINTLDRNLPDIVGGSVIIPLLVSVLLDPAMSQIHRNVPHTTFYEALVF